MGSISNVSTSNVPVTAYSLKQQEVKGNGLIKDGNGEFHVQAAPKKSSSGFMPGFALYAPDITVGSLPLEIRSAKMHSEDTSSWSSNETVPIEDTEFETRLSGEISCNYVMRGKNLTAYAGLGLLIDLGSNIERSNYQGGEPGSSDRGYGAALTFANVGKAGLLTNLSDEFGWGRAYTDIVPRVGVEINLTDKTSLGAKLSYFQLTARTGWDRNDALECDKNYALGHFFPLDLYVRLDEAIVLGVRTLELNTLTKDGEASDISYNKFTPYISFGF